MGEMPSSVSRARCHQLLKGGLIVGQKHLLLFDSWVGDRVQTREKGVHQRLGEQKESPGLRASYTDAPGPDLLRGSQEGMRLPDLSEEVCQALCQQPFTGYTGIACTGRHNL